MDKKIKYGKFERGNWNVLLGLDDPNVIKLFNCIDFMDWSEYELWVHGSILMDGIASDVDITIVGPNRPDQVNFMLETIVACGFAHGVYVDVKYLVAGEIFDYQEWIDDPVEVCCIYATYQPKIEVNGINFTYGREWEGLWVSEQCHPSRKGLRRLPPSPFRMY